MRWQEVRASGQPSGKNGPEERERGERWSRWGWDYTGIRHEVRSQGQFRDTLRERVMVEEKRRDGGRWDVVAPPDGKRHKTKKQEVKTREKKEKERENRAKKKGKNFKLITIMKHLTEVNHVCKCEELHTGLLWFHLSESRTLDQTGCCPVSALTVLCEATQPQGTAAGLCLNYRSAQVFCSRVNH